MERTERLIQDLEREIAYGIIQQEIQDQLHFRAMLPGLNQTG